MSHIKYEHGKRLCEHCGETKNEEEDHICVPSKLLKDIPEALISNKRMVTLVRNGGCIVNSKLFKCNTFFYIAEQDVSKPGELLDQVWDCPTCQTIFDSEDDLCKSHYMSVHDT